MKISKVFLKDFKILKYAVFYLNCSKYVLKVLQNSYNGLSA